MFKIGDKVKISKDSYFYNRLDRYNPIDTIGMVYAMDGSMGGDLNIQVEWFYRSGQPTHNCYTEKDLDMWGLVSRKPLMKVW